MTVGNTEIYFAYDSDGSPMSMVYNGITYYYVKNLQGDVVGIVDKTGVQVVAYSYDAWGNLLSMTGTKASTIGIKNPLRYRGYVYDTETSLYYLQSRYYNPEVGRFLNADALVSSDGFLGNNMFTYCLNSPVCRVDSGGKNSAILTKEDFCQASPEGGGAASGIIITIIIVVAVTGENEITEADIAAMEVYIAKKQAVAAASALLDYASTAASPPPPDKGGKGTKVTSHTLYQKGGKDGFRIDVENPGGRTGQIHLQQGGNTYYYSIADQSFRIGSSNGPFAPNSIQDLLTIPEVIIAIAKGLAILGY